ncbi:hypothetical protein PG991_001082 [Apiospora marii]|uniref:F-box domain-containing protein n=1 Tax=Apiospora marii TaxID=335849 RepID=A0ABR1STU7_9PEZI
MSTETSSQKTRNGLQLLLDLPQELFDLILREVPPESQIALSITCRTARQVFLTLHGNNKTWASRKALLNIFNEPANAASHREFLYILERDLADRYFCCHECMILHPFYDLATETSPAAMNHLLRPQRTCLVTSILAEPVEAFATGTIEEAASDQKEGRFSISLRQLRLVEHFLRYGHGIPMSHFCREIAPASLSLASSPPSPPPPPTTEPVPRWRRSIEFGIRDDRNFLVRERHELVYGGSDREALRRFLDQTPHALCPHLITHDPKYSPPVGPLAARDCGPGPSLEWFPGNDEAPRPGRGRPGPPPGLGGAAATKGSRGPPRPSLQGPRAGS